MSDIEYSVIKSDVIKRFDCISDMFNTTSRLQLGLMVDVVGILRHYLHTHVHDCTMEPATNSSMTSEDFKRVIRNAVSELSSK